MGISLKEIATKAGVSAATISRVVHDSPLISAETKQHVRKFLAEYNYQPNLLARNLAKKKIHVITMVALPHGPFFSSQSIMDVFSGINKALSETPYRMLIYEPSGFDPQLGYPPGLDGMPAQNLILIDPLRRDRMVKFLEENEGHASTVLVNRQSSKLDWVDVDNAQASIQVIGRFFSLGHRDIGFIGGPSNNQHAEERHLGYLQGMATYGLATKKSQIYHGDWSFESGLELGKKILADPVGRPTAIYAASDGMAVGVIQACRNLGLNVPQDLSVFGFDDSNIAKTSYPALSTVRQPFEEIGEKVVQLLLRRIDNPKAPQATKLFQCSLVDRSSCAQRSNQ